MLAFAVGLFFVCVFRTTGICTIKRLFHFVYPNLLEAMDSSMFRAVGAADGHVQDSPSSTQVRTEVDTYEGIAENRATAHVTPVTYSQPELLIRTFQGQLHAMMVEHEKMRQQLSTLTNMLQTWQLEQQRIITLLRRIQEVMDPEFAPGEPLHGLRIP